MTDQPGLHPDAERVLAARREHIDTAATLRMGSEIINKVLDSFNPQTEWRRSRLTRDDLLEATKTTTDDEAVVVIESIATLLESLADAEDGIVRRIELS